MSFQSKFEVLKIELGFLLEMIAENSKLDDLSKEVDDLTITENIDESMSEVSKESEINPTNKRKQKDFSSNSKKFKGNNGTDRSRSGQVDLSSLPGRKFENQIGNNICYINSVLNGLLALDKFREKLNDTSCKNQSYLIVKLKTFHY